MKLNEIKNISNPSLMEDLASKITELEKTRATKVLDAFKKDKNDILKKDATALDVIKELGKADPTRGGNAIMWLVKSYINGEFKLEDISRIRGDIEKFFKFKSKIENKDLNNYKSIDDLYKAIEPFGDEEELEKSKKAAAKDLKKNEVEYLIDTPDFKALIPKTEAAACKYGAGTKWCTAGESNNMFQYYHDQGNLVIIITKKDGKDKKFQLHVESDSFMNDQDRPLSKSEITYLSSFPQYKDLLDIMVKKHYFSDEK
jgi:hypothetical protein